MAGQNCKWHLRRGVKPPFFVTIGSVKKVIAAAIVIAGLAAAGLLADQAVERNREYDRFID